MFQVSYQCRYQQIYLIGINLTHQDFQPRKSEPRSSNTNSSSTSNSSSSGCSTSSMFELGSSDLFTTPDSTIASSSSDEWDERPSNVTFCFLNNYYLRNIRLNHI